MAAKRWLTSCVVVAATLVAGSSLRAIQQTAPVPPERALLDQVLRWLPQRSGEGRRPVARVG